MHGFTRSTGEELCSSKPLLRPQKWTRAGLCGQWPLPLLCGSLNVSST